VNGVLDASMALAWIFTRADQAEAALADRALRALATESWAVPAIWHAEMGNALLRSERAGMIPASQTAFLLERVAQARIEVDPESPQGRLSAVLALARAHRLTAYDATYLELALRTGRTLATFDTQLADATRKAGGRVFGDAV
jgi:predicted nucleic acid-binding protein